MYKNPKSSENSEKKSTHIKQIITIATIVKIIVATAFPAVYSCMLIRAQKIKNITQIIAIALSRVIYVTSV